MKNLIIIAAIGCFLVFIVPAVGIAFNLLHKIWTSGPSGPWLLIGVPLLFVLLAACCKPDPAYMEEGRDYGLRHPAKHRYYHVWTEQDGVSDPLTFAEVKQQHPPETLVCMMHGGVTDPGAWHPLKDYNERGVIARRLDSHGIRPLPQPDLWSTFTGGPQPPNFSA